MKVFDPVFPDNDLSPGPAKIYDPVFGDDNIDPLSTERPRPTEHEIYKAFGYEKPISENDFASGLSSGFSELKALGYGALGAAGSSLGVDSARDFGLRGYRENMEEAADNAPRVGRVEDINNFGDFVDWAQGTLGKLAPTMLAIIAGGGVGGLAAKAGAKKLISKVEKEALESGVESELSKTALRKIAKATTAGSLVGAGATSIGMETGSIYGDISEMGEDRPGVAMVGGTLAGILDVIPVFHIAKKFGFAKELKDDVANELALDPLGKRILKGATEQALLEGGTEVLQTAIERASKKYVDPSVSMLDSEAKSEYLNALAAGVLGGSVMGGVGGIPARQPLEAAAETAPEESLEPPKEATAKPAFGLNTQWRRMAGDFTEATPGYAEPLDTEQLLKKSAIKSAEDADTLQKLEAYFADRELNKEKVNKVFDRLEKERGKTKAVELNRLADVAQDTRVQEQIDRAEALNRLAEPEFAPTMSNALQSAKRTGILDGDRVRSNGKPFQSQKSAELFIKNNKLKGFLAKRVDGKSWVVRPSKYFDERLEKPEYRESIMELANQLVPGGDIAYVRDANENIAGRTKSVNPGWAQEILKANRISVKDLQSAAAKAVNGEKLYSKEAKTILDLLYEVDHFHEENRRYREDQREIKRTEMREEQIRKARAIREFAANREKAREKDQLEFYQSIYDTMPSEVFEEEAYTPEMDGEARAMYELFHEAEELGASEDEIVSIGESQRADTEVAREMYKLIERLRNEKRSIKRNQDSSQEIQRGHEKRVQAEEKEAGPSPGQEITGTKLAQNAILSPMNKKGVGDNLTNQDPSAPESEDSITLYTGSPSYIDSIKNDGVFGGLFASESEGSAGSHGDIVHEIVLPKRDILTQNFLDYNADYDQVISILEDEVNSPSPDELEAIYKAVVEDAGLFESGLDENRILDIFRADSIAEADWDGQRIRGVIAKKLGFKAVEMKDEHGVSYLVLPGVSVKPKTNPNQSQHTQSAGPKPPDKVAKDKNKAPSTEGVSTSKGQPDLLGGKSETAQAIHNKQVDRQKKIDNSPPMDKGSGDLFSDANKQVDIEGSVKTKKKEVVKKGVNTHPLIDQIDSFFAKLGEGKVSAAEFKAMFEKVVESRKVIREEYSSLTKPQIFKRLGPAFEARNKSDKKDDVTKSAVSMTIGQFNLNEALSFMIVGDYETSAINAVKKTVDKQTDQSLKEYAENIKQREAAQKQRIQEEKERIKDPKTIEDFIRYFRVREAKGVPYPQARKELTQDQREIFDELRASESRSERRKSKEGTTVSGPVKSEGAKIVETKHTKKGYDLFVVTPSERVDRDAYKTWLDTAKKLGGWYSSFRGSGAVPGFQFKSRESAEAFLSYIRDGDTDIAHAGIKARRDAYKDDRSQTAIERLREMAQRLESSADEALSAPRKANTDRRARMAAAATASANNDKALASTMSRIADAIENGKTKYLDGVRTKAQVEMLEGFVRAAHGMELRDKYDTYSEQEKHKYDAPTRETIEFAQYPRYTAFKSDLAKLGRQAANVSGLKQIGKTILKGADDTTKQYLAFAKKNTAKVSVFAKKSGGMAVYSSLRDSDRAIVQSGLIGKAISLQIKRGEYQIILSSSEAVKLGIWQGAEDRVISINPAIVDKIIGVKELDIPYHFETTRKRRQRLQAMDIENEPEFRAALREFISLRDEPEQPSKVKELERSMIGRRKDGLDFFPTPESVADKMVEIAEIESGMSVLEPSAGMGHIADRIRAAEVEPDVVELSGDRRELLELKGFNVVEHNFLDLKDKKYDRILMNPPFSDRRDSVHIQHAYSLLKPGGKLVAVAGEGVFFGQDKRASEFREWMEGVGASDEKLPDGSFKDSNLPVNTGANSRLIVIEKPKKPSFLSKSAKIPTKGVTVEDLENAVEDFRRRFSGASQIDFRITQSSREAFGEEGRKETAQGAFYSRRGEVLLIGDNIRDMADAKETIRHEVLVHYGLNLLSPEAKRKILEKIHNSKNGLFLKPIYKKLESAGYVKRINELVKDNPDIDPDLFMAEEVLAAVAEKQPNLAIKVWDEIVTLIVKALQKIGFLSKDKVTKSQLRKLVSFLGDGIKNNRPALTKPKSDIHQFRLDLKGHTNTVMKAVKDHGHIKEKRKTLLGWMTERQIAETWGGVFGKDSPLGKYSTHRQEMSAMVQRELHKVDKIDEKWENLSKEESNHLSDVMADATYYQIHPEKEAYEPIIDTIATKGIVNSLESEIAKLERLILSTPGGAFIGKRYGDLTKRVNALKRHTAFVLKDKRMKDGEAKRIAESLEEQINHLQELANKPDNKNISRMAAIRDMKKRLKYLDGRIQYEAKRRAAWSGLSKRYQAMSKDQKEVYHKVEKEHLRQWDEFQNALEERFKDAIQDEKTRSAAIAEIRILFSKAMENGPYFPMVRFGDYVVTATDPEGQYVREHAETEAGRESIIRDMKRAGYKGVKRFKVQDSRPGDFKAAPGFMADIFKIMSENGVENTQFMDDVHQLVLKSMPEMSYAKRSIHRKGVLGFSKDMRRAFSHTMFHGWNHVSKIKHGHKLQGELDAMEKMVDDYKNDEESPVTQESSSAAQDVLDHMKDRHDLVMNPQSAPWTSRAGNLGFVWLLGASPAAGIVNLTQTALVTYPLLAAKYGAGKAASALFKATSDYMKSPFKASAHESWKSLSRNKNISPDELKMVKARIDDGTIDVTQAHWIAQLADTDIRNQSKGEMRSGTKKLMRYSAAFFHNAETFNREVSLLATYRLAKEAKVKNPEQAASQMIWDSHFDYSSANRAQYMKNDFIKVATMMKNFSQHMLFTFFRRIHQSLKGETKEVRRQALRELTGIMGMHFLFAGSLGMAPFIGELFWAIDLALDDEDEPFDSEVEFRNWAVENFGPVMGTAITKGVFNAAGVDVHSRVSLDDLLFRKDEKDREGRSAVNYYFEQVAGPMYGIISNLAQGASTAKEGEFWRGIETASPKFIRDFMKSARYHDEGVLTYKKDPLLDDVRIDEILIQSMGFTPERVSSRYEGRNTIKKIEKKYRDRRSKLLNQYYLSVKEKDLEKRKKALKEIMEFNRKNKSRPYVMISPKDMRLSIKGKFRSSTRTDKGTYLQRRNEPFRDEAAFMN